MDAKSEVRVLSLFEAFADTGRPMSLSELAERLGIPTSSCFNLVRAVEQRGYLYAARARGALYPTRRLFDIAKAVFEHDAVSPAIRSRMAALRDEVGETVCLAQRRDKEVVYLEVQESPQSIRFIVNVGDVRDLHSNSMGKAILSTMAKEARERLLASLSYRRYTPRTLRSASELEADIERGQERGWYGNSGESAPEALACALPVRVRSEWYGLAIVGPSQRMEPKLKRHLTALRTAARDISKESQ